MTGDPEMVELATAARAQAADYDALATRYDNAGEPLLAGLSRDWARRARSRADRAEFAARCPERWP